MGLFMRLEGIPEPPEGYVPPLGSSRNTWTNIYKNKGRIDYCVQQFGVTFSHLIFSLSAASDIVWQIRITDQMPTVRLAGSFCFVCASRPSQHTISLV